MLPGVWGSKLKASCKHFLTESLCFGVHLDQHNSNTSQCRKEMFIVIKLLLVDGSGRENRLGAELCPPARMLQSFLAQKSQTSMPSYSYIFHQSGFRDGDFPRNISLWYTYHVLIGWFTQLWGWLAPHSCFNLPTRMSVTQGGLGNLNFV